MPDLNHPPVGRWRGFVAALPTRTALAGVTTVWVLGCVWSFQEQTHFAAAKGFTLPWLLPLVIDGLAAAMAGVAYAASLDGRPAIPARIGTALAVLASAVSNAAWAWQRSAADPETVALAIGIPVAANLAFEVLLCELRRQVQRRRGQPPPVAVPYPRAIRVVLAPVSTFVAWRRLVLELTDLRAAVDPPPEPVGAQPPAPALEPERPVTVRAPAPRPVPAVAMTAVAATGVRTVASAPTDGGDVRGGPDERVRRIADLIARGEGLSGRSVAELLGCSPRTGRRLLSLGTELAGRDGPIPTGATRSGAGATSPARLGGSARPVSGRGTG